jgi:hypothetical protein
MNTKSGIVRTTVCFLIFAVLLAATVQPAPAHVKAQDSAGPADITTGYNPGILSPAQPAIVSTYYPAPAAYDSHWQTIAPGETITLTHNLGGSTDYYVVDLRFSSEFNPTGLNGYNQMAYG